MSYENADINMNFIKIINFLEDVADELNNPPSMSAYTYLAGTTHENRIIRTLVLKTNTASRGIFIDCGIHAVRIKKHLLIGSLLNESYGSFFSFVKTLIASERMDCGLFLRLFH